MIAFAAIAAVIVITGYALADLSKMSACIESYALRVAQRDRMLAVLGARLDALGIARG